MKFLRDNIEKVEKIIQKRFMQQDVDKVVTLFEDRNSIIQKHDSARQTRNENV